MKRVVYIKQITVQGFRKKASRYGYEESGQELNLTQSNFRYNKITYVTFIFEDYEDSKRS